ncbi:MAG: tetratricopeptide repeat protein [Armatimonadota bacterium]
MKKSKQGTNRCVQLTDAGLQRLHTARRRYRQSIDNIAWDKKTPSVNTVKRALRQAPVFLDTLERIWDYLRSCAEAQKESLTDLVPGEDYRDYVENETSPTPAPRTTELVLPPVSPPPGDRRRGWLSRQVPRHNRLFLGRRAILDQLHDTLARGAAALIPDAQALTGLGGIGKTQTAIAYVYEHRTDYDGIFWLAGETVDALSEGLAGFAQELNLIDSASASRQEALSAIHAWFQSHTGWLLVIDNADDLDTLAPHFPRHHTGSLLLTTRRRNTMLWAAPVEVLKFDRHDGALLILRRAGLLGLSQTLSTVPDPVRDAAEQLSDALDGLPLALDQAGAYIAETGITLPQYLERFRAFGLDLLDAVPDPQHKPVRITFALAVQQVTRRGLYRRSAVEMLSLCAFLAPDSIPETVLAAYPFPQDDPAQRGKDPVYCGEVSALLCGYSLLRRDPSAALFSIHRLVQAVARETLAPEEHRLWKERAVQAVADASPDFEFEDWAVCDQFLPHWRLCARYIEEEGFQTEAAAYLLYQAGRYVRARALYSEAESLLRSACEIAEKIHGGKDLVTAKYLDSLACLYRDLDRTSAAQSLHERSLAICEAVVGSDHPETASALHNLALLYTEQRALDRAEACFLRALTIRERHLSPDHPGVATTLTQLAAVYRGQERFPEAESCYRRALDVYEKTLDPNHVDLAVGCNNLALLYVSTNRPKEAEPLYLRALQINEAARGPFHPETGTVLWGLAIVQWRQGRVEDAEQTFRRAIAVYRRNYNEDHSRLVRLLGYYADFRKQTGTELNS